MESAAGLTETRDHGGNIHDAVRRFGGTCGDWLDLSTGISPWAYPIGELAPQVWTGLPIATAQDALVQAARSYWNVPDGVEVLPAPGASALIARCPALKTPASVCIPGPTYNEHAAAFSAAGWRVVETGKAAASVAVHPNNPDGRMWTAQDLQGALRIIDESFCDTDPYASLVSETSRGDTLVLKSFGKFWGLGGLRLGFAIGAPELLEPLRAWLGPWPVSGPALEIGRRALEDRGWSERHRLRLGKSAERLDRLMIGKGAQIVGGTPLFRLYSVENAADWQTRLAHQKIWSRVFPYDPTWLRLGLPPDSGWSRLEADW